MQADEAPPSARKYWAFISYNQRDRAWAEWLHKSLETYRIPRRLVGSDGRGTPIPTRLYPVFRDRDELPGAASLGDEIEAALEQSRALIVICSPGAAASRWVGEEIKAFKAMGREDRVLSLVVAGEPNASANPAQAAAECFPEALRFRVDAKRQITGEPTEPIAADVRPQGDGKRNALLKLVAGVASLPFDALRQRDHERRMKRMAAGLVAMAGLVLVFAGLAIYANAQRIEAELRGRIALSRQLSAQANHRLDDELDAALLLGLQATRVADTFEARSVLFNALQRRAAAFLAGAEEEALCLAFSPDDRLLASGCGSETVRLWDTATRRALGKIAVDKTIKSIDEKPRVLALGFGDNGKRLGAATNEGTIQSWDVTDPGGLADAKAERGALSAMAELTDALTSARFSEDGALAAFGSQHGRILLWDMVAHKLVGGTLESGSRLIGDLAFTADGKLLAAAGVGETITLWDVASRTQSGAIITGQTNRITALAFSPAGEVIASGGSDNAIELWNVEARSPHGSRPRRTSHTEWVTGLAFSPDGQRFASASRDRKIMLWDRSDFLPLPDVLRGHRNGVEALAFSHDGRLLASAAGKTILLWEMERGRPLGTALVTHRNRLLDLALSPDASMLALATADGIILADPTTGGLLGPFIASPREVRRVAFDPRGRMLATAGSGGVTLWSLPGRMPRVLTSPNDRAGAVAFSPDGAMLASGSQSGEVTLWDVTSGTPLGPPLRAGDKQVSSLAFSPDGKALAASGWAGAWCCGPVSAGSRTTRPAQSWATEAASPSARTGSSSPCATATASTSGTWRRERACQRCCIRRRRA